MNGSDPSRHALGLRPGSGRGPMEAESREPVPNRVNGRAGAGMVKPGPFGDDGAGLPGSGGSLRVSHFQLRGYRMASEWSNSTWCRTSGPSGPETDLRDRGNRMREMYVVLGVRGQGSGVRVVGQFERNGFSEG